MSLANHSFVLAAVAVAAAWIPPAPAQVQAAQEAAPMRIPLVAHCQPEADAIEAAATLEVLWDGRVMAGDQVLHDPRKGEGREALRAWISAAAGKMEKRENPSFPEFGELPDGLLLLRCDGAAGMAHLQRLLADCAASEPPVWRIHLATLYVVDKGEEGRLKRGRVDISLMHEEPAETDEGAAAEDSKAPEPMEPCEVRVHVQEPGEKLVTPTGDAWSGEEEEHFYFDRSTRKMVYFVGPRRAETSKELGGLLKSFATSARARKIEVPQLVIVDGEGMTMSDAALVMDAALEHGFREISFTEAK